MKSSMPKTIKELYTIISNSKNIFKFDGSRVCEYSSTYNSILEKLLIKKRKIINTYILRPVGNYMATGKPRSYYIDALPKIFPRSIPKCKWYQCGRNIEFGYNNCDHHRILCFKCKKYEIEMHLNGKGYCFNCIRHGVNL